MAPRTALDPNELVEVAFTDLDGNRHPKVKLPRRLLSSGSQRARQNWLIQHGEIPDPSAPPLPEMQEPAEVQQAVIDDARAAAIEQRLSAVEQRPPSNTPDAASLERLAISVQRAAISKEEIVQVADEATGRIETVAQGFEDRLQSAETREQALTKAVSEAVSQGQQDTALAIKALQEDAAAIKAEAIDSSIAEAAKVSVPEAGRVAREVANKHWGSSVTIAPESPEDVDPSSWAQRWYGRDFLIEGDGVFVTSREGITAHRYTGAGWVKSAELLPKVITATAPNITDKSQHQHTALILSKGGGVGNAGGEALLANRMGIGGSTMLADSSNWGGIHDPLSGVLELDLRALDGTMQGRSAVCIAAFTWDGAANDKWTEYALLGDLSGVIQVNLSIQRGNATLPVAGGLGPVTIPPGSQALRIFATIEHVPGAGTANATQFSVRGSVNWNFESDGRPLDATQSGKQPLWLWS